MFREQSPPFQKPAVSAGLVWGVGPHQMFLYRGTLEKLFQPLPRGQTCFPAKLLEGQVQREVLPEDEAGVPPCLMVEVRGTDHRLQDGRSLTCQEGRETFSPVPRPVFHK